MQEEALDLMGDCQFDCGAEEVTTAWTNVIGEDVSQEETVIFGIGNGSSVEYMPKPNECLSKCQVVDNSQNRWHTSCRSVRRDMVKVSKASVGETEDDESLKLCCVPKQCNYKPETDSWGIHEEGDSWKRRDYYKPLTSIHDRNVLSARTCLCCEQETEELHWGPSIKAHCKLAYEPANVIDLAGKMTMRKLTFTVSDRVRAATCRRYCSHYPEDQYSRYTVEGRDLRMQEIVAK